MSAIGPTQVTESPNSSEAGFLLAENAEEKRSQAKRVVVLDTDPGVRWALQRGLQRSGYDVFTASTAGEALDSVYRTPTDAVLLELLPEAGLTVEALSMFAETPNPPRIICVSIESAPQIVIECMRRGAADFLPKPFSLAEVRDALVRAFASPTESRLRLKPEVPTPAALTASLLIGISPVIQELRVIIERVAQTDLNCLIRGESGTGKDMVAREIHRLSHRKDKPFVKVNCTALPEQLLESELFGYERGAFTGATSSKPGRFELAHRGMIFLDEIGDLHPNLQSKLLQVIEHKEFTKLGGKRQIHVDVQILAATNADLEMKTKEGTFRSDLYFRLNEVCIWVSPLSARKEDVPLLVRYFIKKHGRFTGNATFDISGEDLAALTQHDWPGNVRELESTIKRWLALGTNVIAVPRPGDGPGAAPDANGKHRPRTGSSWNIEGAVVGPSAQSERDQIRVTLERCKWNRRQAAETLGMSYQTLRRRIDKFALDKST